MDREDSLFFLRRSGAQTSCHFEDVYKKSTAFARKLKKMGIQKGDTVALILPTCVEFFYSFFGCQMIGAIPYSIYPPLNLAKVDEWQLQTGKMLSRVQTKAVFANNQIQKILHSPVQRAKVPLGSHSVQNFVTEDDDHTPLTPDYHDLAFIQFSSGSTGTPKPVAISHFAALENARQIAEIHKRVTKARPIAVSWLPLYHDMGLVGMCFAPMIGNAKLYFLRPDHFIGNPFLWIKAMSDTKATVTVAPNFAYGLCVRRIEDEDLEGIDLSHLVLAGCGAEMILPKTMRDFVEKYENHGFNRRALTPCYGLAEATLAVTFSDPAKTLKFETFDQNLLQEGRVARSSDLGVELTSVGSAIEGVKIEIRDENENPLEDRQVGEIWIQSPSLLTEYFKSPEESRSLLKDGWLNTQDLGFLKESELFVVGRRKEVIILNGSNIDPSFIEQPLLEIQELRSGCYVAFSVIDPERDEDTESLILVVESKRNNLSARHRLKVQKLVTETVYRRTHFKVDQVIVLNPRSIPRTSSGKIKRSETKKMWLENRLRSQSPHRILLYPKLVKIALQNKLSAFSK